MNKALQSVWTRLLQPSTWAGGGGGFLIIHQFFPGALGDGFAMTCSGICMVLSIVLNEKGTGQ